MRFDFPEGHEEIPLCELDGVDSDEVARLACQLLGIEQPKPDEPFRWPEKKPEVE